MTKDLRQVMTAEDGMSLEASLLAARNPVVGLWNAENPALVCPAAYQNRSIFENAAKLSGGRGWPVVLRPTGGGTVPQGPGILNIAMAFSVSTGFTIEGGYRLLTRTIKSGLGSDGNRLEAGPTPHSFCDGKWNLSIAGQKVVGTAQRWRSIGSGRYRVLAHALILVDEDISIGANAVAAFHHDLKLGPVYAHVHTTLREMMGSRFSAMEQLACQLKTAALRELAATEGVVHDHDTGA